MKGYHNKVNTLAGSKNKTEVSLVVNLFQSVLDGFIRGEIKRMESEPTKVNFSFHFHYSLRPQGLNSEFIQVTKTTKKRKKKDKCVSWIPLPSLLVFASPNGCTLSVHLLNSSVVLWITASARTKSALCSHVTCVAPTFGGWRKPTCAAVSSPSCQSTFNSFI